jgi:Domain of unknown function (DUF4333)
MGDMHSSSRSKHSFSAGSTGFSGGRTKIVYPRRGRSFGALGVRRFSSRRLSLGITVLVIAGSGVIGALAPDQHHTSSFKLPSTSQLNQQLGEIQAGLPTFDALTSAIDVQTALLDRNVLLDGIPVCPGNEPNVPGHSFTCTINVSGQKKDVRVSVTGNQQGLNVGTPTAAAA